MLKNRLKKERSNKELSQQKLADIIGVSQQTIGSWEVGRTEPDQESLKKLSEYFNVSIDYLLGGNAIKGKNTDIKDEIEVTKRDEKDIAKDVNSIMDKIASGEDGPIYYNGEEMDEEDADLFKAALEVALRSIKIENKQKYTPKKYRK